MSSCTSNQQGNQHHWQAFSLRDECFHQHLPIQEAFLFKKQGGDDGGVTGHGSYPTAFWDSLAPVTKPQNEVLPVHSRLNTNDCSARKTLLAAKMLSLPASLACLPFKRFWEPLSGTKHVMMTGHDPCPQTVVGRQTIHWLEYNIKMKSTHSVHRYLLSTTLDAGHIPVDKCKSTWQTQVSQEHRRSSHPTQESQEENPGSSHKDKERVVEDGSPAGKEPGHRAEALANSPTQGHSTLLAWNIQGGRKCQGESWMARQGDQGSLMLQQDWGLPCSWTVTLKSLKPRSDMVHFPSQI